LEILNSRLSTLLTSVQPERQKISQIASSIYRKYISTGKLSALNVSASVQVATFTQLLKLVHFFDLFRSNRFREALDQIRSINIVPFSSEEVEEKKHNYSKLDEVIKRNYGEIIIATMETLHGLYRSTTSSMSHQDPAKDKNLQLLRSQARYLLNFAGELSYNLPVDVTNRLVRLGLLMK